MKLNVMHTVHVYEEVELPGACPKCDYKLDAGAHLKLFEYVLEERNPDVVSSGDPEDPLELEYNDCSRFCDGGSCPPVEIQCPECGDALFSSSEVSIELKDAPYGLLDLLKLKRPLDR